MSTAKVIFTYKRKRLSSHSGVDHEDVCAEFSSDVSADKPQDASNERITSPEKNLMNFKRVNCDDAEPLDNQNTDFQFQGVSCGKKWPAACSSVALQNSSRLGEKYDVQRCDTPETRKMISGSYDLPGNNTFKISGELIPAEASLGETSSSTEKDSCLLHSSYLANEGCMQESISISLEKDVNSLSKQSCMSQTEVAKGKSSAPLLTFSRRVKRKANTCATGIITELPFKDGDAVIKECDIVPVPSCTCEVASKESSLAEKSVVLKVESDDADMRNMLCQSSEKMISSEIGDSSCLCGRSCAETLILRHTEMTNNSQEDLAAVTSSVTKLTANRISKSMAPALNCPGAIASTSLQKNDVRCSVNDGPVISSYNLASKMDDQPVSQRRASSGDSQLTSSDSSDLKIGAAKKVEHRLGSNSLDLSRPPPGAFVIDCNVVPESDVQDNASDIIQDPFSVKNSEKVMQEGYMKSKGLELFGSSSVLVEDLSEGVHTSNKTESKPKSKYLQLFSEGGKNGCFTPSNTHPEIGHSIALQNAAYALDIRRHHIEQYSSKASDVVGLSLPTELYELQTSKDVCPTHQSENSNVGICGPSQNPAVQSFPDQASLRHKILLESINTRATSLRGNRNISLDKFEPCPAMWSEEELDSLWIGIRRHGRGNWRAMLLDPRLRFAPWRVAVELEKQWEREQYKLFNGQHMPSSRYLKPPDAYKSYCHGPVLCHGTGGRIENVAAETQLSLGDVYAQKDGASSRSCPQSMGITPAQKHVTMASYGCGPFNYVQASSVMIRGDVSLEGPAMAFGMNNGLPHWLRDPINTPPRPLDPPCPPIPTLPQMGGLRLVHAFPETSGTSFSGKNQIGMNKLAVVHPPAPSHLHCSTPLTRKPGMADNLIVIDSDASSEETISDDHNN